MTSAPRKSLVALHFGLLGLLGASLVLYFLPAGTKLYHRIQATDVRDVVQIDHVEVGHFGTVEGVFGRRFWQVSLPPGASRVPTQQEVASLRFPGFAFERSVITESQPYQWQYQFTRLGFHLWLPLLATSIAASLCLTTRSVSRFYGDCFRRLKHIFGFRSPARRGFPVLPVEQE